MRPMVLAAMTGFAALCLACGSMGAAAPNDGPTPGEPNVDAAQSGPTTTVWLVASTRTPWPLTSVGDTVLAAFDGTPDTSWMAADGEVATLFAAGGKATTIHVQTQSSAIEVRAFKPSRMRPPAPSAWKRHEVQDGSVVVTLDEPQLAVEVRVPGGGVVDVLTLGVASAVTPRALSQLSAIGGKDGAGNPIVDVDQVRIGEVDLERCMVRKPLPPPDADFKGSCTRTQAGLVLKGELPYIGALDETVAVTQVTPCLWIVDGWPLAGCQ